MRLKGRGGCGGGSVWGGDFAGKRGYRVVGFGAGRCGSGAMPAAVMGWFSYGDGNGCGQELSYRPSSPISRR